MSSFTLPYAPSETPGSIPPENRERFRVLFRNLVSAAIA
jgi:hypothetical protein